MLLRLNYACACSNKWETVAEDNLEGECSECGVKSWPAEIRTVGKDEKFTLTNDVKPWRPSAKAQAGFAAVAQTMLPCCEPIRTAERVQHLVEQPYSHRRGRAEKAKPLAVGLFDDDARNQLDLLDAIKERA
jgi:hypothetical protein